MKKFLACALCLCALAISARAQLTTRPATQAEVNAGTLHTAFVAPDTLKGWTGGGLTPAQTNTLNNAVTNNQSFVQGGKPLTLDLQASGATLSGQLQGGFGGKPWKFIYAGTPVVSFGRIESETNVIKIISEISTNGVLAALTNDGSQVAIYCDVGALSGIRNTNWNYVITNHGTLTANINLFPRGIPWLVKFCATNGVFLGMQVNSVTNILPTGADSYIADLAGGGLRLFTNSSGALPTNSFGQYSVVTTSDSVDSDASELTWWGVKMITPEMITAYNGDYKQSSYAWGRALLHSRLPTGWGQTNIPVTFNTQDTTLLDFSTPNQFNALRLPTSALLGNLTPPVLICFESVFANSSLNNAEAGYVNAQNSTGFFYDNTSQGGGGAGFRRLSADFPNITKTTQGAYISFLGVEQPSTAAVRAMTHGFDVEGYTNDVVFGSGWGSFLLYNTNALFNSIANDPLQNWPLKASDGGTNQSAGYSVWSERLVDGNLAVTLCNEATNNQSVSVNWGQLGLLSNTVVHVYGVEPSTTDYGIFVNSYSQVVGSAGSNVQLLKFVLLAPVQESDGQQWVNTLSANATSFIITKGKTLAGGNGYVDILGMGQGLNGSGYQQVESAIQLGFDGNTGYGAQFAATAIGGNSATQMKSRMGVYFNNSTNWGLWTDGAGNSGADHIFITSAISVTGTNAFTMNSTGYTNVNPFDIRVFELQGTSVNFTNLTSNFGFSLGTLSVNNDFLILHTNEALIGTAMSAKIAQ